MQKNKRAMQPACLWLRKQRVQFFSASGQIGLQNHHTVDGRLCVGAFKGNMGGLKCQLVKPCRQRCEGDEVAKVQIRIDAFQITKSDPQKLPAAFV